MGNEVWILISEEIIDYLISWNYLIRFLNVKIKCLYFILCIRIIFKCIKGLNIKN